MIRINSVAHKYRQLRHTAKIVLNLAKNVAKIIYLRALDRTAQTCAICLIEHIGDIVACEPISKAVKEENPGAIVYWLVKKQYHDLVKFNSNIDIVINVHCLTERIILARLFDKFYDLHFSDRFCPLCLSEFRHANESAITLKNYFNYGGILKAIAEYAGIKSDDVSPTFYFPPYGTGVSALIPQGDYIIFHCRSNTQEKDWKTEKWDDLANQIIESTDLNIVEVGMQPVVACDNHNRFLQLSGKLTIMETADAIKHARLFIGIDSGPAHIANAVGTPGVVLIGSYLGFDSYNPFSGGYASGEKATLIRTNGAVATISVGQVMDAVTIALKKI